MPIYGSNVKDISGHSSYNLPRQQSPVKRENAAIKTPEDRVTLSKGEKKEEQVTFKPWYKIGTGK